MDQQKVFFEGSERKKSPFGPKKHWLKIHQNLHFFKGVSPWFLSKNGDFLIFSFYAKWIENKGFLKVGSKNHQIFFFKKKVSPWFLSKNGDFLILSFMQNGSRKSVL